ncbi:AgmX/PglI C-terminal domain-containing protein [Arsukibacterium indicum]|uniref:AgmX/PglI C-terminal domain-containing protein n=1 Tax=Arsukibacterium indicum TaxID=2848612 RepID=A0ABS6MI52_9GAMM|nr:AgmX/PglI C-terminal domain-containing protein [Arsukibacterium indicum]MBV2128310.1 AgmX/PglI C-terminal domain-containing protein [Arsukibacterium indicum]
MTTLSWQAGPGWQQEDQFFTKTVIGGLIVLLLLSIAVPLYQVPERSRQQLEQLPPQLARVMLEQREIVPPEPIELPEPEPVTEPEPEPEQQVVEASPVTPETARAQAQQAGLLAMQDELAALRQTFTVNQQAPQLQRDGQQAAVTTEPERITNPELAKTAAKAAAAVSADVARAELNRAENTTLTEGELRGLAASAPISANSGSNASNDAATAGGRSEASIRQTLEANKSSLYTLYNRALRANPLLKGKVVFELIINPDGSLQQVNIVESELNDERLERQLTLRLQAVNFGAADVKPTRSKWTIAFLPG